MLVHDIMQSRVITATPRAGVAEALGVLRARGVRHLIIVDGDALVGIVSDRDLKQAGVLDERLGQWTVGEIMTRSVITIEPSAPVEDAAQLMLAEKISSLPDIVATVQVAGAPVSSVVTLRDAAGVKDAVIRIGTIDPRPAIAALTAKSYTVKTAWRGGTRTEQVA